MNRTKNATRNIIFGMILKIYQIMVPFLMCTNIKIGNDVLIAPNTFVNFDVPDHSIVIGNPAKIIHRENATEGHIPEINN